jgi:toxin-antitoxin system PIN domain toxin
VTFLLDVNVLIALIDPGHVAHDAAHDWFAREGKISWASCPMTENGVVRVVGSPRYPNSPGSPAAVAEILHAMLALDGHIFWPDSISLLSSAGIDPARILTSAQVTDSYLLALAKSNGGMLATLDRKLSPAAVAEGRSALCLIEG